MKNNRNLTRLVDEFLKTSPRSLAIKRSSILPPQYKANITKLPTDQQYIKNFIVHVDCSYMFNYYGPPTVNQHKMFLHKKSFVNPLSVGLVRRKAIQINDQTVDKKTVLFQLIKGVNKDKHTVMKYTQLQEFIMKLNVDETKQYKKFIVYLYKWLLNEKHNFPAGSIQQQMCQQTSEIIIKKIYESHQKGDYQLLKNTQEELLTIQNLQKARQFKRNGKLIEAKEIYEMVYFARLTEQIDRLEALGYICQRCKDEQDIKFLQKMVGRIKQGYGLKSHQKTLQRAITQINDLQTPIQSMINPIQAQSNPLDNPSQQMILQSQKLSKPIILNIQQSTGRKKENRKQIGRDTISDGGKNN